MLTFICVVNTDATFKFAIQSFRTWADAEGRLLPSKDLAVDGVWILCQSVSQLFAVAEEARGKLVVLSSVPDTLIATGFCSFPLKLFTVCPIASSIVSVCTLVPLSQFQCLYSK